MSGNVVKISFYRFWFYITKLNLSRCEYEKLMLSAKAAFSFTDIDSDRTARNFPEWYKEQTGIDIGEWWSPASNERGYKEAKQHVFRYRMFQLKNRKK